MKEWQVDITQPAEEDIDGIYMYIAETLMEPVIAWNQVEAFMMRRTHLI